MYLTRKQNKWLEQNGGRNETDVLQDERGRKFVFMSIPGGEESVYLPIRTVEV